MKLIVALLLIISTNLSFILGSGIPEKEHIVNLTSRSQCIISKAKSPWISDDTKETGFFFRDLATHVYSEYPKIKIYIGGLSIPSIFGYIFNDNSDCDVVDEISLHKILPIGEPIDIIYKIPHDQQSRKNSESVKRLIEGFSKDLRVKYMVRYNSGSQGILENRLLNSVLPVIRAIDYNREWDQYGGGYMAGSLLQTTLIKISKIDDAGKTKDKGEIIMGSNVLEAFAQKELLFQCNPYWKKRTFFDPNIESQRLQTVLLAAKAVFDHLQLPSMKWESRSQKNINGIFRDMMEKFSMNPMIVKEKSFDEFITELNHIMEINVSNARAVEMKMDINEDLSGLVKLYAMIAADETIKKRHFMPKWKSEPSSSIKRKSLRLYIPISPSNSINECDSVVGMLRGHYVANDGKALKAYKNLESCKEASEAESASCYAIQMKEANVVRESKKLALQDGDYDAIWDNKENVYRIVNAGVLHTGHDSLYDWLQSFKSASDSLPDQIKQDIVDKIMKKTPFTNHLPDVTSTTPEDRIRDLGLLFYSFLIREEHKTELDDFLHSSGLDGKLAKDIRNKTDKADIGKEKILDIIHDILIKRDDSESLLLKMILFNYSAINQNVKPKDPVEIPQICQNYLDHYPSIQAEIMKLPDYEKLTKLWKSIGERIDGFCNSERSGQIKTRLLKKIIEEAKDLGPGPSPSSKALYKFVYSMDRIVSRTLPIEFTPLAMEDNETFTTTEELLMSTKGSPLPGDPRDLLYRHWDGLQ